MDIAIQKLCFLYEGSISLEIFMTQTVDHRFAHVRFEVIVNNSLPEHQCSARLTKLKFRVDAIISSSQSLSLNLGSEMGSAWVL